MGFHDHYYATTYDATDVSQAAIEQEEDEEEDKTNAITEIMFNLK